MRQPGHIQNQNKGPNLKGSQDVHGAAYLVLAHGFLAHWFFVCGGPDVYGSVVNVIATREGGHP